MVLGFLVVITLMVAAFMIGAYGEEEKVAEASAVRRVGRDTDTQRLIM